MRTRLLLGDSEGKGALGCLMSLLLLGVGIFAVVQIGPPYFAYKSLETDVSTEVSRAGAHFFSDEALTQNILDVARKNEVSIKKEDIKIERYAGQVHVQIEYRVPVDLMVLEHTFDFRIKASSYLGSL
jgi:hypothetical protein